jgi:hypothetical protein
LSRSRAKTAFGGGPGKSGKRTVAHRGDEEFWLQAEREFRETEALS